MEIKRMDLTEFRDLGFLQEVNRLFFHPRGLALEVIFDGEDSVVNITSLGGIWDSRDDPEGIVFCDGPSTDKARNVQDEYDRHAASRNKMFGWIIQPVGVGVTLDQITGKDKDA